MRTVWRLVALLGVIGVLAASPVDASSYPDKGPHPGDYQPNAPTGPIVEPYGIHMPPDVQLIFDNNGNPSREPDLDDRKPRATRTGTPKARQLTIPIPPHRIFALNRQGGAAPLSFEQLMAELASADVVICGEYHDDPATHQMELALLAGYARVKQPGGLRLSMEMFERDVQPALSAYVLANPVQALSEKQFLEQSRPWGNYKSDYRPLIEYARQYAIPVVAANAPTPLARRVGREGWAVVQPALTDQERGWLAQQTSAPEDGYWTQFNSFMGGMGGTSHGGGMTEEQIRRFYEAQTLKDDTMAEAIVDSVFGPGRASVQGSVFQVNGSFHSDYGYGVAQRVRERAPELLTYTIAIRPVPDFTPVSRGGSLDPQGETLADGTPVADFVIFVPAPDK